MHTYIHVYKHAQMHAHCTCAIMQSRVYAHANVCGAQAHICVHVHKHAHTLTCTHTDKYTHLHVHMQIYTHTHTNIQLPVHTHLLTHGHTRILSDACMHNLPHTHTHTHQLSPRLSGRAPALPIRVEATLAAGRAPASLKSVSSPTRPCQPPGERGPARGWEGPRTRRRAASPAVRASKPGNPRLSAAAHVTTCVIGCHGARRWGDNLCHHKIWKRK